jgi:hypothetical protein
MEEINYWFSCFWDFYDNPNPNIRRQKRQRIYGTVTGACGERKYTVKGFESF